MKAAAFWFIVSIATLSVFVGIGQIGKPQKPRTPAVAIVSLVLNGLMIYGAWVLYR